ncbi:TPA: LysR substrate-binding domain-containing protein [Vibrio cholerae]
MTNMKNNPKIEWNDLFYFMKIIEKNGFTSAADSLGVTKSKLSRRLSHLEQLLGIRLIQRNTRSMNLTDAGKILYQQCIYMFNQAETALNEIAHRNDQPSGNVRLSLPVSVAKIFAEHLLTKFREKYPNITLTLIVTNKKLNLIENDIDVVIRGVGAKQIDTSDLVQACLCTTPWSFVCSKKYLEKAGSIESLADLDRASFLFYSPNGNSTNSFSFINKQGDLLSHTTTPTLQSDNLEVLYHSTLNHLGVCGLPEYMCKTDFESGKLVKVLSEFRPKLGHIMVMFPNKVGLAASSRALIEFLKIELPILLQKK